MEERWLPHTTANGFWLTEYLLRNEGKENNQAADNDDADNLKTPKPPEM
jgi:hypothetical protein